MSLKEELLQIKTYEEYEPQREKNSEVLLGDKEVLEHLNMLYGKGYVGGDIEHGLIEEVYKTPPGQENNALEDNEINHRSIGWWYF